VLCLPCPCSAQRDHTSAAADLALEREAAARDREALERRAEALQQVGTAAAMWHPPT
jgi:hypothetical protein